MLLHYLSVNNKAGLSGEAGSQHSLVLVRWSCMKEFCTEVCSLLLWICYRVWYRKDVTQTNRACLSFFVVVVVTVAFYFPSLSKVPVGTRGPSERLDI